MLEWKHEIRSQLAGLKLDPTRETEIVEELAQHLEERYRELVTGGAGEEEADRVVLAELRESELLRRELKRVGSPLQDRLVLGATRRNNVFADLWQDLRYAARMPRKNPGFTAVAVLTLALGIGVNTAFFTMFSAASHPLPVTDPETVVEVDLGDNRRASLPEYVYFRNRSNVFSGLTAGSAGQRVVVGDEVTSEQPQEIYVQFVSENFFSVLHTSPQLGRTFTPNETEIPGGDSVVVLSDDLWQGRFGGDPNILGRTLRLNSTVFIVVGVMPPDFIGYGLGPNAADVWLPLMTRSIVLPQQVNRADWFNDPRDGWLTVRGRLGPHQTLKAADSELAVLSDQFASAHPEINSATGVRVVPLSILGPFKQGRWGPVATMIIAATGIVLLIACSNIANLLLARAAGRSKEIGVRLCLGASRGRVIRQLLTESLLLAALGGVAALVLAWWSLRTFLATALLSPAGRSDLERVILNVHPDVNVLICTVLLSVVTGLAFGLVPALRATRNDLATGLKSDVASFGRQISRSRLPSALVVAQVALCLVLLIAAGLFLRGLGRMLNRGLETRNLLTVDVDLRAGGYTPARAQQFREELAARLDGLPGVQSVARAAGDKRGATIVPQEDDRPRVAETIYVTPSYFGTLDIPIVNGRGFTVEEMRAPAAIVMVSESTANNLRPNQEAVGRELTVEVKSASGVTNIPHSVIGVVQDTPTFYEGAIDPLLLYLPLWPQYEVAHWLPSLVRTRGTAQEMKPLVRATAEALDPSLLVKLNTVADSIANDPRVRFARVASILTAGLGLLAMLLACVGLYGVMSYSVSQRTREIGIRIALGANRESVMRMVLGQGLRLVVIGVVLGIAGGAAVSRVLPSIVFGLGRFDPVPYAGVTLFLIVVALVAMYLPARRAAAVDPMEALRYE